jgi:hypothetical protein
VRLVIVDDSEPRVALIKNTLSGVEFAKHLDVIYCGSADAGRRALMTPCDLLLLDVLIPKKKNGTPQAKHSIELLTDICSSKKSFIRPRLIIGLTADVNELSSYQSVFANEATVVLRGTLSDVSWLTSLTQHVESLFGSNNKASRSSKDCLLISVHGIRTFGHWQENISKDIAEQSRSFECIELKYGFLDLVSFLFPRKREPVIERNALRLLKIIKDNQNREISIIAHSFGTFIVARALSDYSLPNRMRSIIFCGSPMLHQTNIDDVVGASEITLNDCGVHDFVLLAARFFGPDLGDAGRIGFARENSDKFRNRYFRGGHALYFNTSKKAKLFYEEFWLPIIIERIPPRPFDARRSYFGHDFVDLFISIVTSTKPFPIILITVMLGILIRKIILAVSGIFFN